VVVGDVGAGVVVVGGVAGFAVGCDAGFAGGWVCAASSGANGSPARLTMAAMLQMRPTRFVKFIAVDPSSRYSFDSLFRYDDSHVRASVGASSAEVFDRRAP
jgi:hypothetical protein